MPQKVLVFDLGGRSTCASVVEVVNQTYKEVAMVYDLNLGGKNFTDRIVDDMVRQFIEENDGFQEADIRRKSLAIQTMTDEAEKAKILLSEA